MKQIKTALRRLSLTLKLAAASCLVLCAAMAMADVVLHPGTVHLAMGLSGWSFQNNSVTLDGNPNGFQSSKSFTGDTVSLTVEGNQTYTYVRRYSTINLGSNTAQFTSTHTVSVSVPVNGVVSLDLNRPGGTILGSVSVTGGTLLYASLGASTRNPDHSEFYSSSSFYYAETGKTRLPMVASNSVELTGAAFISLVDARGQACTVSRSLPPQSLALSEGQTLTVTMPIDVTGTICAGIAGLIHYQGKHSPSSVVVRAGPSSQVFNLHPVTYEFRGMEAGLYSSNAWLMFPSLNSTLHLPNQNPPWVTVSEGQIATRDFIFDGASFTGSVRLTGSGAELATSASIYHHGIHDPALVNGGPSAGGSAFSHPELSPGSGTLVFQTPITPGTWNTNNFLFHFSDSRSSSQLNQTASFSGTLARTTAMAGGDVKVLDLEVPTSEGRIIFDVIEPPGSPVIGISNPTIYASMVDSSNPRWQRTMLQSYGQANNAPTPSVRLVGPPGTYSFDAYATVQGTWTRFAQSTIELGRPVNTPVGSPVVIRPPGTSCDPDALTLEFARVTESGDTSIGITDVGPAAPQDHQLLNALCDKPYLNITTSAKFEGKVELAIRYDHAALGLTPEQEARLKFLQFVCTAPSDCHWEVINESYTPGDERYFGRSPPPGGNPNRTTHTLYGVTRSLSLFAIALPHIVQVPPTGTCIGSVEEPAQLETEPGLCSVTVNNENQLAGGCSGGGGGLRSCTFSGQPSATLGLGAHNVTVLGTAHDGSTATCDSHVHVADRAPATLTCSAPVMLECIGTATPHAVSATCDDNCGSCSATCGTSPFPLGETSVHCNATDASSNVSTCTTTVTVVDTTPPALSLSASPAVLWPPNHKHVPIILTPVASDRCDNVPQVSCTASSSEPDNGLGDGDTAGDILWKDGALFLRAERSGKGAGRTYTITCTATDASGNSTARTTTVAVPHSLRR